MMLDDQMLKLVTLFASNQSTLVTSLFDCDFFVTIIIPLKFEGFNAI